MQHEPNVGSFLVLHKYSDLSVPQPQLRSYQNVNVFGSDGFEWSQAS